MGCSPSKGQLFAGVSAHKALKPGSHEGNTDFLSNGTETQDKTEISIVSAELTILEDENTPVPLQGDGPPPCDVECDTTVVREAVDIETNVDLQEELLAPDKTNRKDGRKKKNRAKRSKQKEKIRKPVHIRSKVELPEKLVKANQAAYAYLDTNIPKYESLLGLLDQATKTQLSLQPMVALLASRYEEINQALEEMAAEGEQMLEENGAHMAWPAAYKESQFNPSKPDAELYSSEPSSDLLQQMIHHSTEKLRLIGDSVKGLGDAALEEAVVNFASISQLLGEKLEVKRAAEGRLKQVLHRVEVAVLRKSSLEDSALHSEDSGIGADNECQNGSVRFRRHRESSGSGSSTGSSTGCPENTISTQPHLNGVEEDRDDDDDDDEDDEDEDEEDSSEDEEEAKDEHGRKTSVTGKMTDCSQANPCKFPLQASLQSGKQANNRVKKTGQIDTNIRRPQTAGNPSAPSRENPRHSRLRGPRRSQSADCLYFRLDDETKKWQEKNQKDNQKPESKGRGLAGSVVFGGLGRTRVRRNSLEGHNTARCYGLQYGSKGPFKATIPPNSPPAFVPAPPGRNAVKRLINTFSQGAQDSSNQKPTNVPTKVKGTKKAFLPMLSKGGVSTNGNNNNNSYSVDQRFSDRPEDVDVDSLPPPPPEVLMDNSFESNEGPPGDEDGTETQNQVRVVQRQRGSVSQRLRASLQTVAVLPSRASVPRRTQSISPARPIRQDAVTGSHQDQDCDQTMGVGAEKEVAANLYQQSRKIIHLRNSSDSPAKTGLVDQGIIRAGSVVKQGSRESGGNESLAPYPNSYPPTTPPVSRARLPPSCPTARHRIPSPPALPTSPACEQLGASVRPSSPGVQRWSRRSSDEENSFSFCDARSVFCQESAPQSLTPSCRSTLPRPWGEPPRGRLQTVLLPQTFMKSSPSGVRHTFVDHQQPLSSAMQPHSQDIERRDPSPVGDVAQELPDPQSAQVVTGAQEAESRRITDNQD